MSGHTPPKISPGPWEWQGNKLVSLGAQSTLLRDVVFWNPDPGDKLAIAAAPDMLEALKASEEFHNPNAAAMRRAAIAKAEGKQ